MNRRGMPVNIRNHIANFGDPYLPDLDPGEVAICRECRSVYANHRWELESQAECHLETARKIVDTLCPACQKIRDHVPSGIVTLSGNFISAHETEILQLIRHENVKAMEINPLERIMDIENSNGHITVLTTNEKLAQRIGKGIHKAFSGAVEYKWSEDDKLVRVNWRRD